MLFLCCYSCNTIFTLVVFFFFSFPFIGYVLLTLLFLCCFFCIHITTFSQKWEDTITSTTWLTVNPSHVGVVAFLHWCYCLPTLMVVVFSHVSVGGAFLHWWCCLPTVVLWPFLRLCYCICDIGTTTLLVLCCCPCHIGPVVLHMFCYCSSHISVVVFFVLVLLFFSHRCLMLMYLLGQPLLLFFSHWCCSCFLG